MPPLRQKLLQQAAAFTDAFHIRIVRTGFDQWFPSAAPGAPAAPMWQQNMLVLLMLYPVVFLFGLWVQTPLLMGRLGLSFPMALFVGNIVGVLLLNVLVPWISRRFDWWLNPRAGQAWQVRAAGTAVVIGLYGLLVAAFKAA